MLNFGWAEMMVIGVVALIVIGPDDLPDMFRQLGRFTGKLRTMSREFSRAMEQAAKDTGVKDVAKDLKAATSTKALGLDAVKSAADKFEKWDPIKNAAKPSSAASVGAKPLVPAPMPEMPKPAEVKPAEVTAKPETPFVGPATQALYDKQALKAQVLSEQSAKLRAIEAGTYQPEPVILPPVKASKAGTAPEAAAKPAADQKPAAESAPSPKPRKTRTVNKADQS